MAFNKEISDAGEKNRSSEETDNDNNEVFHKFKYRLVNFFKEKAKERSIDIVPSTWIFFDEKTDQIVCKFKPGPFSTEDSVIFRSMVENRDPPLEKWPTYPVKICGRAESYNKAEILADKLNYQTYAYSTDNDASAKQKAQTDTEFYKSRPLPKNKVPSILQDVQNKFNNKQGRAKHIQEVMSTISKSSKSKKPTSSSPEIQKKHSKKKTKSAIKKNKKLIQRSSSSSDATEESCDDKNEFSNISKVKCTMKKSKKSIHIVSDSSEKSSDGETDLTRRYDKGSLKNNSFNTRNEVQKPTDAIKKSQRSVQICSNISEKCSDNIESSMSSNSYDRDGLKNNFSNTGNGVRNQTNVDDGVEFPVYSERSENCLTNNSSYTRNSFKSNLPSNVLVENNTDFLMCTLEKYHKAICSHISQLCSLVIETKLAVEDLRKNIQILAMNNMSATDNLDIQLDDVFGEISVPCRNEEEFNILEAKLIEESSDVRVKLTKRIKSKINKKLPIVKNLGEILRFYLVKELALKFNAIKPAKGKRVFKDTKIYKIIEACITDVYASTNEEVDEKRILEGLSSVFHHCRDWDGGRSARNKINTNLNN